MSDDGLVTIASRHTVRETLDRLEKALKAKDITVFARIDHAAGAASVAMPLRPTELLIFGNPKGGTPLMQSNQTVGIDLPLKCLVWQDAADATWISYNETTWIARRHQLSTEFDSSVSYIADVLSAMTRTSANHGNQTV